MKIVIPGGTGQVGNILGYFFQDQGHEVVLLSRGSSQHFRIVSWDGRTLGNWAQEIDGADVVINLAGRSVNCRYTKENLKAMMDSRVESTRVVGSAIEQASHPPAVWLQMSTATIYSHRFDAPNDEETGQMGGNEKDTPAYWKFSTDIAQAWEQTQKDAKTPRTRKVALRTAMVMSPDAGGVFDVLLGLTRRGIGGPIGGGKQYVSWIHGQDFAHAVDFLIQREDMDGPVNLAAPNPIPQADFMAALRKACGVPLGLPATKWMVELGAVVMKTDAELVLKSRRVIPTRLLKEGFTFQFPHWAEAAKDLLKQ